MSNTLNNLKRRLSEDSDARADSRVLINNLSSVISLAASVSDNNKVNKFIVWSTLAISLASVAKGAYNFIATNVKPDEYIIKINESDPIFDIVEDWFMQALPEDKQLSVYAHSIRPQREVRSRFSSDVPAPDDDSPATPVEIGYTFDGEIMQELSIAGLPVKIFTSIPDDYGKKDGGNFSSTRQRSINIVCPTLKSRNAVLEELSLQAQTIATNPPKLYISSKWGTFRPSPASSSRSVDTVFLKDGQMERIFKHIDSFKANKPAYIKSGIPYRTGILLHGEPGSGKTSTAAAIAHELKMDVYVVSISSIEDDDTLGEAFNRIPSNSVVILEDIDVSHSVKDREDDSGVTMSGMLNVLDGFQSPSGVIMIMTTNRLDVLDPAIIRPGRVDIMENLSCLDMHQLKSLCTYFIGSVPKDLPEITPDDFITSADVIGIFRNHLPNFSESTDELVDFLNKKTLTPASV